MDNTRKRTYWQASIGVFLIVVGGALLLNGIGVIEFASAWRLWPVLIIVVGLMHIAEGGDSRERARGLFWILIGSWLLAAELHLFGFTYHNSWPVLLIALGLNILLRPASRRIRTTVVSEEHHAS